MSGQILSRSQMHSTECAFAYLGAQFELTRIDLKVVYCFAVVQKMVA